MSDHLRVIIGHLFAYSRVGDLALLDKRFSFIAIIQHPVDVFVSCMVLIVTELEKAVLKNEGGCRQAYGQSKNIDC